MEHNRDIKKQSPVYFPVSLQDKTIKCNKMKKIFTLALGMMITAAMFAADRKPIVTVSAAKRYTVVIDGRQYRSNGNTISISNLFNGQHDIRVYKGKPGFFINASKLMASSGFQMRNNDVRINIDRFGQIQISESRFSHDWSGHDNHRKRGHDYGQRDDHDTRF
jgi:hypothetical protein